LNKLPIYNASQEEQQYLIETAHKLLLLNLKLQEETSGFKHWIQKEFNVDKLSNKLEKYYELTEDEFIAELRKKKVNTKLRNNREYLEKGFNDSIRIIKPLLQQIKETDNEIDNRVYDLYGLTDEEIKIIESSL